MAAKEQEKKTRASHLPEHGPIAENGKEVLLSVKMSTSPSEKERMR